MFGLFRRKKHTSPKNAQHKASAEGFQRLLTEFKEYAEGDVVENTAVSCVLYLVELSIKVLINVAMVLGEIEPAPTSPSVHRRRRSQVEMPSPAAAEMNAVGRRSVHSRPVSVTSIAAPPPEEEEKSSDSFSFEGKAERRNSFEELLHEVAEEEKLEEPVVIPETEPVGMLRSKWSMNSLESIPEHALLRGFVRTPSNDQKQHGSHVRHMSLDGKGKLPDLADFTVAPLTSNPPSPFIEASETVAPPPPRDGVTLADDAFQIGREATLALEDATAVATVNGTQDEFKKPSVDVQIEITPTAATTQQTTTAINKKKKEGEFEFESPCSSPRSVFSDSVATEYFTSNFCNPEYCLDSVDCAPAPGCGGSLRQRYTLKRLQSVMSQRSRRTVQTPSIDGSLSRAPGESLQSFRARSFRNLNSYKGMNSFRSRAADEDGMPVLSDAYRMVKLESCIRRAWKFSMDETPMNGEKSNTEQDATTKQENYSLASFKKMTSRRFNRSQQISFVKVPADFSPEMLMSRKEMMLNPAFGDEVDIHDDASDEEGLSATDGETINDHSSVIMRNPLKRMGSYRPKFKKCEKNFEEGAYDNPLRLCSFRSYDSDTELELTSVRDRNPISRLLSFRVVRGLTKDGIPLAEIEDDEYGAMVFDQVNANPIQGGLLDKYLTQLVIDDTLTSKQVDIMNQQTNEAIEWSTCDQAHIPTEQDDKLRCLLMDRFLLDNVLNEMDVNLGALELARVRDAPVDTIPAARKLRRS